MRARLFVKENRSAFGIATFIVLASVSFSILALSSWAATSYTVNYQGKLLENDSPIADGCHNMIFKIYEDTNDDGIGDVPRLIDSRASCPGNGVTTSGGLFSVLLDLSSAQSIFDVNNNLYLEVTIEGQALTPMKKLALSPRAFWARKAGTATTAEAVAWDDLTDPAGVLILNLNDPSHFYFNNTIESGLVYYFNNITSGGGLVITSDSTVMTGRLLSMSSNSSANTSNGIVSFDFSGAHTGLGISINSSTVSGTAMKLDAGALVGGKGLHIRAANTATTGNALYVESSSTANLGLGGVRFDFSGAHTGKAFYINDATQTGTVMSIVANSLTSGSALSITSDGTGVLAPTYGLLYVANTSTDTGGITARIQSNSTAGSGLTVSGLGRVGIGTDSPAIKLDVRGTNLKSATIVNDVLFQVASSDSVDPLALKLGIKTDATQANRYGSIEAIDGAGSYRHLILQGSGGNVGLGTVSPSAKLDVKGLNTADYVESLKIRGGSGQGNTGVQLNLMTSHNSYSNWSHGQIRGEYDGGGGFSSKLTFFTNQDTIAGSQTNMLASMTLMGNGKMGVGTTSPLGMLQVNKNASTASGLISITQGGVGVSGNSTSFTTVLRVGDEIITAGGQRRRVVSITNDTALTVDLAWYATETSVPYTYRTNAFFVDYSNGRVGIGTVSPGANLDVFSGDIYISSNSNQELRFRNAGGTFRGSVSSNTSGDLRFLSSVSSTVAQMVIRSNGNIGIGIDAPSVLGDGGSPKLFQVNGDGSSAYGLIQLSNNQTATGTVGGITFGSTALSTEKRIASIWANKSDTSTANGTGDIIFTTYSSGVGTEKVRIKSDGAICLEGNCDRTSTTGRWVSGVINIADDGTPDCGDCLDGYVGDMCFITGTSTRCITDGRGGWYPF